MNRLVTRNNLGNRSHQGYFMGYAVTTRVIIYWKPYCNFVIYRDHQVWFDEYNYHISIEYKDNTGSLFLQQYPEIIIHNKNLLNLIPCELDINSTQFSYTKIITYGIQLTPTGKKIYFNLLDDKYFTIPYANDTMPNSQAGHQLTTPAKQNVWIIDINGESLLQLKARLMN